MEVQDVLRVFCVRMPPSFVPLLVLFEHAPQTKMQVVALRLVAPMMLHGVRLEHLDGPHQAPELAFFFEQHPATEEAVEVEPPVFDGVVPVVKMLEDVCSGLLPAAANDALPHTPVEHQAAEVVDEVSERVLHAFVPVLVEVAVGREPLDAGWALLLDPEVLPHLVIVGRYYVGQHVPQVERSGTLIWLHVQPTFLDHVSPEAMIYGVPVGVE